MVASARVAADPVGGAEPSLPPFADRPGFDVESWLILQKGNLAVAEEVRALVADAVGEIARTQCRYLQKTVRGAGPGYLWKGLALKTVLRREGVKLFRHVSNIELHGRAEVIPSS